uniref:Uncharacterized protein n=1 Tax=Arundo donax TaxID=35708 RepID=A0A0A9GRN0_ARUDO
MVLIKHCYKQPERPVTVTERQRTLAQSFPGSLKLQAHGTSTSHIHAHEQKLSTQGRAVGRSLLRPDNSLEFSKNIIQRKGVKTVSSLELNAAA